MTDLEIIYLIRESKNKDAFNYLLNKYWKKVYGYTFKWYKLNHLVYPLEQDELKTVLYDCFLKAVLTSNLKFKYYSLNFFPKIWFIFCRNTILNYNRTDVVEQKGNLTFNGIEDKHIAENVKLLPSLYSGSIHYRYSDNLFAEYILELTNDFLKENKIMPKNKKWIIDKLSHGGERTTFDDKNFTEKEKVVLWRQYQITKKYLKDQLSKIIA